MGSAISRTAVRRYPSRTAQESSRTTAGAPSTRPELASTTNPRDGTDPDYASMLRQVGAVSIPDAARSLDLSGSMNPQLRTLERRSALADGKGGVGVEVVREILRYRDGRGMSEGEIERVLGLPEGVAGRLRWVGNTGGGDGGRV